MAGLCGLVIDHDCNEAEAWYMILPEQWGRGLATAAMRELLAAGFESHGLDRIWACVVPVNRASSRVLEKAGLRFESETRGTLPVRGEWQDSIQYGISREEWGAVRRSDDCTASGA
jgi:RimJ/RimL family protein N-acetyltransferase